MPLLPWRSPAFFSGVFPFPETEFGPSFFGELHADQDLHLAAKALQLFQAFSGLGGRLLTTGFKGVVFIIQLVNLT